MERLGASLSAAFREVGVGRRTAAVVCLLLALLVQVLLALRWRSSQRSAASLNCGNFLANPSVEDGATCGETFLEFRQDVANFTGYMAASSDLFEERLIANGTRPTVLCIGQCSDLCTARAALRCWQRFLPRIVIVDPDPEVHFTLQLWLAANAIEQDSVRTVNASLCADSGSASQAEARSCTTPQAMLQEAQLAAGDVDVLWIADSPGSPMAAEAVGELFALQDFAPQFVTASAELRGAGYAAALELPGQRSLVPLGLREEALLSRKEQRARRRARLRTLHGYLGSWMDGAAAALVAVALAAFVGRRLASWAVQTQGMAPSLEQFSTVAYRVALSAAGFCTATSFVGALLRMLSRWRKHRELTRIERRDVNMRALGLCFAQVFVAAVVRALRKLYRQGKYSLAQLAKRGLKYLALFAVVIVVIDKVKPVVKKLRVPVTALIAELQRQPKALSCGSYAVPEPDLSEECEDWAESHLEGSRPDFEGYLAGLVRSFTFRPPGSRPNLVYIGTGTGLCELRASYPCLSRFKPSIVVVEPNPRALPSLQRRLADMGLAWPQVKIVRAAVAPSTNTQEALATIAATKTGKPAFGTIMSSVKTAGFKEFFKGFQGSEWVFSTFSTDQSAKEPGGHFHLSRIPRTATDKNLIIRAKVYGGACGEEATMIEFRVGLASIEYLKDGRPRGWRPISDVKLLYGKVKKLPNFLWTGENGVNGWAIVHLGEGKATVFGGSSGSADHDFCLGTALSRGYEPKTREKIVLSYKISNTSTRDTSTSGCKRRALVGSSSQKVIPDTAITASSVHHSCSLNGSRLDAQGPGSAWCPRVKDKRNFIKWDLGSVQDVSILQLKGRSDMIQQGDWVSRFRLWWSVDDESWLSLPGADSYMGNSDANTRVEVELRPPLVARYIVLAPLGWQNYPSLRAEFVACDNLQMPFYAFRPWTQREWAQLPSNFPEVSSITYKSLLASHLANFGDKRKSLDYELAEWAQLAETHVEELTARRLSPFELLQELGVSPGSVDLLSISARGCGLEVLADFLAVEGLHPTALRAEPDTEAFDEQARKRVLAGLKFSLKARGYRHSTFGPELLAKRADHFPEPAARVEVVANTTAEAEEGDVAAAKQSAMLRRVVRWTIIGLVVSAMGVPLLVLLGRLLLRVISGLDVMSALRAWKDGLGIGTVLRWAWWLAGPGAIAAYISTSSVGAQTVFDVANTLWFLDGHQVARVQPHWLQEIQSDCQDQTPARCTAASWKTYAELIGFFREVPDAENKTRGDWKWDWPSYAWTAATGASNCAPLRSEPFRLEVGQVIRVISPMGHPGWSSVDVVGKQTSSLDKASSRGFVGVALRDVETDTYLVSKTRSWEKTFQYPRFTTTRQELVFTAEELAEHTNKEVTLDAIDLCTTSGCSFHLRDVTFEGACAQKCDRYIQRRATLLETSLSNLTRSLDSHFATKAAKGLRPVAIHIGAGSSLCELAAMHPCLKKWSPRHIFFEPNFRVLPHLRRRLHDIGIGPSSATIVRVAVVPVQESALPVCSKPRALVESIPDSAITASGNMSDGPPAFSRMNGTGWIASVTDLQRPWLQWDFGRVENIFLLHMRGRPSVASQFQQWVDAFSLSYSDDGLNWERRHKVFAGNVDKDSLREIFFWPKLKARFVRLRSAHAHLWPVVRAEFFACDGKLLSKGDTASFKPSVLHTFEKSVSEDFPGMTTDTPLNEFAAIDRRVLEASHADAFTDPEVNPGMDKATWDEMLSRVRPIDIRTTPPSNVLSDVGVNPVDVDMLTVDARGLNIDIVKQMLEIPNFRPAYIRFEWGVAANLFDPENDTSAEEYLVGRLEPLIARLADMYYTMTTEASETVAIRQELVDMQPRLPLIIRRIPSLVDIWLLVQQDSALHRQWAVHPCGGPSPPRPLRVGEERAVRCCWRTTRGCFKPPGDETMTFAGAQGACRFWKARVCSREELESDVCKGNCHYDLVWSRSTAYVVDDTVAAYRDGVWTRAKVLGVDAEGSYALGWFDKAMRDQMRPWQAVHAVPMTWPRSILIFIAITATVISFQMRLARFAWELPVLGELVNSVLNCLWLTRRLRVLLLGVAMGHDFGGWWTSRLVRLPLWFALCPPGYRGDIVRVAFAASAALRLFSFAWGGPWIGIGGPEKPLFSPDAFQTWPDRAHLTCSAAVLAFYASQTSEAVPANLSIANSTSPLAMQRMKYHTQVCRTVWREFLTSQVLSPVMLLSSLGDAFRAKARYGERPVMIHIGPGESLCELRMFYACLSRFKPQVHIVEPNPFARNEGMDTSLRDISGALNLMTGLNDTIDANVTKASLCVEESAKAFYHTFAVRRLLENYPLLNSTFWDVGSTNRTAAEAAHRANFNRTDLNPGYSQAEWEAMMRKYMMPVETYCFSPVTLMRKLRVQWQAVDILTINAKGQNLQLMSQFLSIEKFWPSYIRFEWEGATGGDSPELLTEVFGGLESRGYRVGFPSERAVVAVHASLGGHEKIQELATAVDAR